MKHTVVKKAAAKSKSKIKRPRRPRVRPLESAKSFKVTVTANPGAGPDPIAWDYDSGLKGRNGNLVFNKKNDGMKHWDYYLVEFVLDDRTNLGLQFDPNPMKAFWVAMGDDTTVPPCPQAAAYDDQIYAISDDPNGRSLTVRNDDDEIEYFRFSLGFIDSGGHPHRYDPIGQNENGGVSFD
jgi:hypothetical protein